MIENTKDPCHGKCEVFPSGTWLKSKFVIALVDKETLALKEGVVSFK